MATVTNQWTITIGPKVKCDSDFLQIKKEVFFNAFKSFTKQATPALYMYLAANASGYAFGFSPKAVENAIGVKEKAFYSARDELIALGHLVMTSSNHYTFYEVPVQKASSTFEGETKEKSCVTPQKGNELYPSERDTKNSSTFERDTRVPTKGGRVYLQKGEGIPTGGIEIDNKQIQISIDIDNLPPITLMQLSQLTAPYEWIVEEKVVRLCNGREFRVV